MPSQELINMLQKAVSMELQVSIQYMWQHVRGVGMNSLPVTAELKTIAIEEMKHAEEIAERLDYFGVMATTEPTPITVGKALKEMIALDQKAEEDTIALYKQIIKRATEEGEFTTRRLFMKLLDDEEEHHNTFTTLLE
ncbi:MAG: bacterioferritin [Candidatus Heimdallarchaeota archaeon]